MKKFFDDHLGWILFLLIAIACSYTILVNDSIAGSNTLTTIAGGKVKTSHVNQFKTALIQDFLPRDSNGIVATDAGSLGDSTRDWLKAFVASGSWAAGDVKLHHSFDDTVGCGHGWMLADGRIINEANYNIEHGAATWATYVVSSPLDGLILPDHDDSGAKLSVVGVTSTTQDGTASITSVGNASHQVDVQHTHTMVGHVHNNPHVHRWYTYSDTSSSHSSHDSAGSTALIAAQTCTTGAVYIPVETDGGQCLSDGADSYYTATYSNSGNNTADTMNAQLSTTQSIQDESIEYQFCMRIIN